MPSTSPPSIKGLALIAALASAVLVATFLYSKLHWPGALLAPVVGLLLSFGMLRQWRTGKALMAQVGFGLAIVQVLGVPLWAVFQVTAITALFCVLPMLFGRQLGLSTRGS